MTNLRTIPLELISYRADARQRSDEALLALEESIQAVGLINPPRVRLIGDRYEVIAGAHRIQVCDALGWTEVPCFVSDDDDLHAELAMIDENLCRAELSPADRAKQTARRKAIYLELHPETAEHVAGGKGKATADNLSAVPSFAAETARMTGKDERSIRRDAERGEKVIDAAIDVIRGTSLDTGTYLDKLKKLSPSEQVFAAKRDLAHVRQVQRERANQPAANRGGIAGRYIANSAPTFPPSRVFERFVELVDEIETLPVSDLVEAAGRQRSVLGQRASGLADRCGAIMEALDR